MSKRVHTRMQSVSLALILLASPHLAAAPGGAPPPAPSPLYALYQRQDGLSSIM